MTTLSSSRTPRARSDAVQQAAKDVLRRADVSRSVRALGDSAVKPWKEAPVRSYLRTQATNDSVAMTIDQDFHGGGVANRMLVQDLWRAESGMHDRMRSFQDGLDQIARKHGFGSLGKAMEEISGSMGESSQKTVKVSLETPGGVKVNRISLGQAMDLVAMDPATRARVEKGNPISFVTRSNQEFIVTPEQFRAIEGALTPGQRAMVRDVKAYMDRTVRSPLFQALRRIKGWEPEKVPDYWPSRRNRKLAPYQDGFAGWNGAVDRHLEDAGFTQNREGGKTPFLVGDFLDTALEHVRSASAIIHMAEPIRSAEMVFLHPEVRAQLDAKYGEGVTKRIEGMLQSASELGQYTVKTKLDRLTLRGIQGSSRALTSLNYRAWMRQLGGVMTLAGDMSSSAFRAGIKVLANPAEFKRAGEEMTKHSGFFWARYAESPSAMMTGLGSAEGVPVANAYKSRQALKAAGRSLSQGRYGEAARVALKSLDGVRIASYFDSIAARVAWAGYRAEAERIGRGWSEAQKLKWAAEQAEFSVRRTQNTFSVLDSSEFLQMARHQPMLAAIAAFTGDSSKALNQMYQASHRGKGAFVAAAGLRAANILLGSAITAGMPYAVASLAAAVSNNSAGEERRKDRALATAADSAARDAFGTVLGGDKVYDLVAGALKGATDQHPLETPAGGQVRMLAEGLGNMAAGIVQYANSDEGQSPAAVKASEKFLRGVEKVAIGGATLGGVPIAPLVGDAKRATAAANATHVDDLLYERKKLRKIPELHRSEAQADRLADLDAWFTANSALNGQVADAKEDHSKEEEAELRKEQQELAKEYITPAERKPVTRR